VVSRRRDGRDLFALFAAQQCALDELFTVVRHLKPPGTEALSIHVEVERAKARFQEAMGAANAHLDNLRDYSRMEAKRKR